MSDTVSINRRAMSLDVAPEFDGYSGIIINVDDETQISSGDTSGKAGRVLTMENPQGTQEMADNLLEKMRGRQYQPYKADGALLDPAAEMGDGVSIKDTYGGIYSKTITFTRLMAADIAAPADEEIDHEYKYESPKEKKTKREIGNVKSLIEVTASQIRAEVVSKEGGNNESFGWSLLQNEFALYSNSNKVFWVNKDGANIKGTLQVGAKVGSADGFTISATAIYKNLNKFGSTAGSGVYIGTDGIQLGQNFKVDSTGNLTAASGTFSGAVRAGSIQYGGANGTFSGAGITSGSIGGGSGGALSSGVRSDLKGGNKMNGMETGDYAATSLRTTSLIVGGKQYSKGTISFIDGLGQVRSFNTLLG